MEKELLSGKTKKKDWFPYYLSVFDSVEINYSFYRWPNQEAMQKWHDIAPKDFIYSFKAPRKITHVKRLIEVGKKVEYLYKLTSELHKKMGCHLFQLPPSFKRNEKNEERVRIFLKDLDKKKFNAIEFRSKDWWHKDIFDLFEKENAIFVSVFGMDMPEKIIASKGKAYLRFHGNNYQGRYSKKKLQKYSLEVKDLDLKKVFAYFNNDEKGYAAKNALEFRDYLGE